MTAQIIGFICALVLAALVIIWIAYCMFCRERHKSESYQYNISDLKHKNYMLAQEEEKKANKKKITAGIFVLPSRHKQRDESYDQRPDYPESPPPVLQPGPDKLMGIFDDNAIDADAHFKDGIIEINSNAQYHSEV